MFSKNIALFYWRGHFSFFLRTLMHFFPMLPLKQPWHYCITSRFQMNIIPSHCDEMTETV